MKRIILASKSARRQEILRSLGIEYTLFTAEIDEAVGELPPEETVRAIAERKCRASVEMLGEMARGALVISADTVVSQSGEIFGKPKDREDAVRMLGRLSGGRHFVHTGIAVSDGGRMISETETSEVHFRNLTRDEIRMYVDSGEPMDKAGAYGIQEVGSLFVDEIQGDYFNIVGLPVCRLAQLLRREFGYDMLAQATRRDR